MRHVCGLDVHKDSVFVCILNENGSIFQDKFGVLTPELEQMAATLQQYDVEEVCMESTSIYWMPVWRVLEPYVADLKLVNPYFIKQLHVKCLLPFGSYFTTMSNIRTMYFPDFG